MSHVDTDVMCPAGFQPTFDQTGDRFAVATAITLQYMPMRHRLAAAFAHRALVARLRVAIERRVDCALRTRGSAPYDGQVTALERPGAAVIGELPGERLMCTVVFRHH